MSEKSLEQMLGLERKETDAAYIREKLSPRSVETEADVLVLALALVRRLGVNDAMLVVRDGLRKKTLIAIRAGECLQRNRDVYLRAFVRELNNVRLRGIKADDERLRREAEWALAQVALVQNGLATDALMVTENRGEVDAQWRRSAKARGVL